MHSYYGFSSPITQSCSQIHSHDTYVHVAALFAFSSHSHRAYIDFLLKTEIPKQLSLLRRIVFDCLSYNFAIDVHGILNFRIGFYRLIRYRVQY